MCKLRGFLSHVHSVWFQYIKKWLHDHSEHIYLNIISVYMYINYMCVSLCVSECVCVYLPVCVCLPMIVCVYV